MIREVSKDDCWLFARTITSRGYGLIYYGSRGRILAHRAMYETSNGEIPDGLVIDHLCRVRRCINPSHLEVVTHKENILRGTGAGARNAKKTHCPKGHAYSEDNIYWSKAANNRIQRHCRTCNLARFKARYWAKERKK